MGDRKTKFCIFGVAGATLLAAIPLRAHGGELDSEGGHTDRRMGEYHKHRGPDVNARADAGDCSERSD